MKAKQSKIKNYKKKQCEYKRTVEAILVFNQLLIVFLFMHYANCDHFISLLFRCNKLILSNKLSHFM